MSEAYIIEDKPTPESTRDLRGELTGGSLTALQFLAEVFERDQQDQTRSAAEENLALLCDSEVVALLSQHPEAADEYHNLFSVSAFHIAQQKLVTGDVAAALPFLEQAAAAAEHVGWAGYRGWKDYVRSTLAYASGNNEEFTRILGQIPEGDSYRDTLVRLAVGLQKRGTVDYGQDYGSS